MRGCWCRGLTLRIVSTTRILERFPLCPPRSLSWYSRICILYTESTWHSLAEGSAASALSIVCSESIRSIMNFSSFLLLLERIFNRIAHRLRRSRPRFPSLSPRRSFGLLPLSLLPPLRKVMNCTLDSASQRLFAEVNWSKPSKLHGTTLGNGQKLGENGSS